MMRTLRFLVLVPLFFVSCKKESSPVGPVSPPASPKITTGAFQDVTTQTIPSTGGVLTVNSPGDPLDGLQLTVPPGAYAQSQAFTISRAEIKAHQFGTNFNPSSPMIRIACDGGYAADELVLKVPVRLARGSFAMGFFYDEAGGKLEPISVRTIDSAFVTLTTRHFSPSDAHASKRLFKTTKTTGDIVISTILESVLSGHTVIPTGFTPGVDDWEFPNCGSYIAPVGHCAGECATAIWYYYEKKARGEPQLYGRYDRFRDPAHPYVLWQDNPLAYKLASVVQNDMDFPRWPFWMTAASWVPSIEWNEFAYSTLLTGEPQLVGVRDSHTGGGHALVAYKIDLTAHLLYVADPNFPGVLKTIEYLPGLVTGSFKPYTSSEKAGDPGHVYDQIGYLAVTSHIDWAQIGNRWGEFQAGTIASGLFPQYTIYQFETGTQIEFLDSLVTAFDTLYLACESDECDGQIPGTANRQVMEAYDPSSGAKIDGGNSLNAGILRVPLKVGTNEIGLAVYGTENGDSLNFVDFKWVHVFRRINLTIGTTEADQAPIGAPGVTGKVYTFLANSRGQAPKGANVRYVWEFGDGTAPVSVFNDSTVTKSFSTEGFFPLKVTVYDGQRPAGEGRAQANIGSALAAIRQARIDLMNVEYYRSCTDSGRAHIESWAYECTNGTFTGSTFNASWMDTVWGGYPQVPVPFSTTMKVSLTLNRIGALCVADSFRVVRLYYEPWGCTITEVLTGRSIPWDSGHPEDGYMNYVVSGAQLTSNVAFSWVEHCLSGGCEDKIIQYSLAGSRLDIHFY